MEKNSEDKGYQAENKDKNARDRYLTSRNGGQKIRIAVKGKDQS